jgi:hypothetical protein
MVNPFAGLKVMPKLFKRMASGEVLASDETTANFGLSRLRLTAKREVGSGEVYAVLTTISSDARQHFHLSRRELDALANIARVMQSTVREGERTDTSRLSAAPNDAAQQATLAGAKAASPSRSAEGRKAMYGIFSKVGILVAAFLVMVLIVKLLLRPQGLFGGLG